MAIKHVATLGVGLNDGIIGWAVTFGFGPLETSRYEFISRISDPDPRFVVSDPSPRFIVREVDS